MSGSAGSAKLSHVVSSILRERGVQGLYSGYRATLLRNIPSAVLRFALYEELKLALAHHRQHHQDGIVAALGVSSS